MSVTRRDSLKKEKEYEELFPLDSKRGVLSLLYSLNQIGERRFYEGDMDACVLLMDLELSIEKAGLTKKQKEILNLLYYKGLTQKEAAEVTGSSQQAVLDRKNNAIRKIISYNRKGF
jgi:DNA-directed RNA polymerase specialized sigma subunit